MLSEISATCDRILVISNGKIVADAKTDELSSSTAGEEKLALVVEGAASDIISAIKNIPAVIRVNKISEKNGNSAKYMVEYEKITTYAVMYLTQWQESAVRFLICSRATKHLRKCSLSLLLTAIMTQSEVKIMVAILKRELSSYFNSAVAYVVMAVYFLFSGLFFSMICIENDTSSLSYVFGNMFIIILFIIPIITMKSFSEEKRQRTDQALLTSPTSLFEIVMGKFLGALILFAICSLIFVVYALVISFFTSPDWAVVLCTVLGLLLLGSALIAIDIFISVLTESMIISAVAGMGVGLLIYMLSNLSSNITVDWIATIVKKIDFLTYYTNFTYGMLNLTDIIFFLSVTGLFLFFTARVLEKDAGAKEVKSNERIEKDTVAENTAEVKTKIDDDKAAKTEKPKKDKKKGGFKNFLKSRKARHGSIAAAIVAIVIALVIVLNIVVSLLVGRFPNMVLDFTKESSFALENDTIDYVSHIDKDIKITVLTTEEKFEGSGAYYIQANKLLEKWRAHQTAKSNLITLTFQAIRLFHRNIQTQIGAKLKYDDRRVRRPVQSAYN